MGCVKMIGLFHCFTDFDDRMEMGLFRCLSSLYLRGSSVGKTEAQLLEEKPLVVGARVWLAVRFLLLPRYSS